MAKRTITIWWVAGTVVMFVGGLAALFVSFSTDPGNFLNGRTGLSVALLALCFFVAGCGVIFQLVGWIGALFNTRLLSDRTWFKLLLWLGIAGIVTSPIVIGALIWWTLMLVYLIGGPDGAPVRPPMATPAKFAPTS